MGISNYVTDHLQSLGPTNWPSGVGFPPVGVRHGIPQQREHSQLIGQSPALREILTQVEIVAPTDSTVLIVGETGTGKELIARALHNLSFRREQPFIKVNCAAIPSGLLESELFGHERGAFTSAISQRIGRFELAQLGTLFLDEVGDIPLELQPKLLRVLQEKEFERLGSARTLHVDIRLVAATSCKLAQMVEDREFRSDLYYRLNVFPISVPPLRDRREDISLLTCHFVKKYAQQMNKSIDRIPEEIIRALFHYHWPGNIRELQNVIERAVILTQGKTLTVPLEMLERPSSTTQANHAMTLKEAERQHILRTLGETMWAIGGPRGAAVRLGVPRTSLIYKMQKLGIPARRDMYFAFAESPGAGRMSSKAPFVKDSATVET
jgi:formate hydrogenlyase transcriptional activator